MHRVNTGLTAHRAACSESIPVAPRHVTPPASLSPALLALEALTICSRYDDVEVVPHTHADFPSCLNLTLRLEMQPAALRRVLKSLSPRKHANNHHNHHQNDTVNPASHPQTSPARQPHTIASPPPDTFEQEYLSQDPTAAVEQQYNRYLTRLSRRAEAQPSLPANPLSHSPPPSPPTADRTMSRLHRRAMRDITIPHASNTLNAPPRQDSSPPTPPLPPMHVAVDPAFHFRDFVRVGNGASGTVFFAHRRKTPHEHVALKKVTPSTRAKSKALENEIRTMHVLRHPNIVQCHEAYSFDGSVWIVMEAMNIGCLTSVLDFLRAKAYLLSESHIAYILRETLKGLWAMHSQSCMHRDIKSDNILVSSDGDVKLGDFEYTAVLTEETPKRNTVVGTAWWMAPETVRSSYYDYGADVWSIGILSVECAEWVPPLFGMESSKAMEVIRSGATIQGFKRPDMWSIEFADFVRGCLTRDRNVRYTVPDLLRHPFLDKACTKSQIANVFRAVRGMKPIVTDD